MIFTDKNIKEPQEIIFGSLSLFSGSTTLGNSWFLIKYSIPYFFSSQPPREKSSVAASETTDSEWKVRQSLKYLASAVLRVR